jgi:hypothetical protein
MWQAPDESRLNSGSGARRTPMGYLCRPDILAERFSGLTPPGSFGAAPTNRYHRTVRAAILGLFSRATTPGGWLLLPVQRTVSRVGPRPSETRDWDAGDVRRTWRVRMIM